MGIASPPYRLWISIIVFFIAYITFTMQVNFLSSITANGAVTNASENSSHTSSIAIWPIEMTSHVIDSYFWGYVLASVPAGLISDWYGPYNIIMYSLILMVFMNSLCVRALEWHFAAVIVCRIILGGLSGGILPSLQTLISNWSPPGEKGRFTSTLLGSSLGLLVSWFFTSTICSKFGVDWGFHTWSIQAAVICLIFGLVASNRPQDHNWVTFEEKKFIKESQRPLISNLKVICLMVFIFISLIFEIIFGFLSGYVDDVLKVKMPSKRTFVRRCFIICSHLIPGLLLLLILIPQIAQSRHRYIILAISFILTGSCSVGFNIQNIQDLAPNFAGSVYGLINAIGGISFLFVPSVQIIGQEAFFTPGKVQLLTGIILVVTGIFSAIFVSGQTQEWNFKVGQRTDEELPIREDNRRFEPNGILRVEE